MRGAVKEADMQLKDAQLFRQQAFIDGAWVDADNGQTIKVNNPATGEILGTCLLYTSDAADE